MLSFADGTVIILVVIGLFLLKNSLFIENTIMFLKFNNNSLHNLLFLFFFWLSRSIVRLAVQSVVKRRSGLLNDDWWCLIIIVIGIHWKKIWKYLMRNISFNIPNKSFVNITNRRFRRRTLPIQPKQWAAEAKWWSAFCVVCCLKALKIIRIFKLIKYKFVQFFANVEKWFFLVIGSRISWLI